MIYIPPYCTSASDVPLFTDHNRAFAFNRIEHAARTCYKSESSKEDYKADFLNKIFKARHLSVFEHSNFVVKTTTRIPEVIVDYTINTINNELRKNMECSNPFLKCVVKDQYIYYGGNLRAWIEALGLLKDENLDFTDITTVKLLSAFSQYTSQSFRVVETIMDVPPELRRYSVQITHDRAFTHELVRHRVMSFSQESQRYCNYSQGRFKNRIVFIEPARLVPDFKNLMAHKFACWVAEKVYMFLISRGVQAQIARSVLPNATKTEIFVSGDREGWDHLFALRTSAGAHPDMVTIMVKIHQKFRELDSWE